MYQKGQKYFADWRDSDGRRLRKSFTSKRAALTFEAEQKELAHPKHPAKGKTVPISFSRPYRAAAATTRITAPPPGSSSKSAAPSSPTTSRLLLYSNSITGSPPARGKLQPR